MGSSSSVSLSEGDARELAAERNISFNIDVFKSLQDQSGNVPADKLRVYFNETNTPSGKIANETKAEARLVSTVADEATIQEMQLSIPANATSTVAQG